MLAAVCHSVRLGSVTAKGCTLPPFLMVSFKVKLKVGWTLWCEKFLYLAFRYFNTWALLSEKSFWIVGLSS